MNMTIGILGIGMFLPPEIRHNDWWPDELVASWHAQRRAAPAGPRPVARTDGEARVLAALAGQVNDSFHGVVERHVMPDDMSIVDMEEHAAKLALERAGIDASKIDLLLTHTVVADYLLSNPACLLHHRLGLPRTCFAMETDAATYSFMMQLTVAEAMIASGRATHALLVQSCATSRLIEREQSSSPAFGDGATAVVVGRTSPGRGILSAVHYADGRFPNTLIASVPKARWFDPGRALLHIADPAMMQDVLLQTLDLCNDSVVAALAAAKRDPSDVAFLCMHQGTPWLRALVQDYTGLTNARSIETYSRLGYMFSAIQPSALFLAERDGLLAADDLVVLTGGGTGMTFGAVVMQWGS